MPAGALSAKYVIRDVWPLTLNPVTYIFTSPCKPLVTVIFVSSSDPDIFYAKITFL